MQKLKVSIDITKLDNKTRQIKAIEAAKNLEIIVNSKEFKEMIINMQDNWRMGESSKYKHYSTYDIYDLIMSGSDEYNPTKDNTINLYVDDYYSRWSKVVGYMIPGNKTIFVNTKFFDNNSIQNICSNFLHEYLHVVGFRHAGKFLRSSIPYYMNHVIEVLYKKLVANSEPVEYKKVCKGFWIFKRCYLVKI